MKKFGLVIILCYAFSTLSCTLLFPEKESPFTGLWIGGGDGSYGLINMENDKSFSIYGWDQGANSVDQYSGTYDYDESALTFYSSDGSSSETIPYSIEGSKIILPAGNPLGPQILHRCGESQGAFNQKTPETEENSSLDTAQSISTAGIGVTAMFSSPTDVDYYSFTAELGNIYLITLDPDSSIDIAGTWFGTFEGNLYEFFTLDTADVGEDEIDMMVVNYGEWGGTVLEISNQNRAVGSYTIRVRGIPIPEELRN